jgi:hypothetical protein
MISLSVVIQANPMRTVFAMRGRCASFTNGDKNGSQQLPRPEEYHFGEHAGLKVQGRILDAAADLGATRVQVLAIM